MGMVRISEEAEKRIKEMAAREGKTFTATVDALLASTDIASRLDKMGAYLKQRLDDLEAALDGAVLSSGSSSSSNSSFKSSRSASTSHGTPVDWETLRDLWLDYLPYGADEWLPGREEAFRNSDNMDMGVYYIKNDLIVSDDMWGHTEWMKVSPRVKDYLMCHGVEGLFNELRS